jgi:hypothetical protein
MLFATLLILVLQQGMPGQPQAAPDSSGAWATALLIGIAAVILIAGIVMAFKHASRRRNVP